MTSFQYLLQRGRSPGYFRRSKLDCQLLDGHLNSDRADLLVSSGSQITFSSIDFRLESGSESAGGGEAEPGISFQRFGDGTLKGAFSSGTTLVLSSGTANPTSLVLDSGSEVTLGGLELSIEHKNVSKLAFHNESVLKLNVLDGQLALAGKSFVHIQNAQLSATFTNAEWQPGKRPNVTGEILLLSVNVSGGVIEAGSSSTLHIVTGRVKASNLTLNSLHDPIITGPISELSCEIASGDRVTISDDVSMTTGNGSRLSAVNSLQLAAGKSFLSGKMTIDVNFRDLGTRDGSFVVSDGKAHFPLQVSEGGVLTSPYKQAADGSFVVEARDRFNIEASRLTAKAKSGELRATVKMSEGKVLPGQPPSVDALWSGTFEDFVVNAVVPETLQRVPGHDDARIFPVRMQARLDTGAGARRSFANQAIAFRSGKFVADVAFPLDIIIEVPQGGGEYKDRDDVSKGTEGGNDEYSHSQEVWRDKRALVDVPLLSHAQNIQVFT